jgi:flagellar biosynthesis/type III secretory pathway chaperone
MEDRVSELLGIIREEISLYRDLIEHARRKTALLVQGSLQAILESNKVEETFNIKLRMLEDEVRRLCLELCQAFRLPREGFTLLKLAEGFEKPVAEEIKSQTGLFRNLIEQLKSVNQRNMKLIESSVSYSRGLLDLLANATSSYQATGLFRPIPAIQRTISHRA